MGRESLAARRVRAQRVFAALESAYPDAHCALDHADAYQLLVATILSAQCTDVRVNLVTPAFFARYPDARALAEARQEEVEELIRSTGFFRNKAKNLIAMAREVTTLHGGRDSGLDGRAPRPPGRRPQDGERRAWQCVRAERRRHGGHPRRPDRPVAPVHRPG